MKLKPSLVLLGILIVIPLAGFSQENASSVQWTQGSGPNGNFVIDQGNPPVKWGAESDENIAWRLTLPETGQSTVVAANGSLFFTIMKPVEKDSTLGKDIVAYCCDAETGKVLWTRELTGEYPLRLSGCFSDSSSPPPVTDGERVCFFNASGGIACFDFAGKELWVVDRLVVGRAQPFLQNGLVHYIRQSYLPDEGGHFTHANGGLPQKDWTQLQALDMKSGEVKWTSTCGVNMGSVPLPQKLQDGRLVAFVGRGGGHSPPERPEGISMVSLSDGKTIWTLPLEKFMATQMVSIHGGYAIVYHQSELLKVGVKSGEIVKSISMIESVPTRLNRNGVWNSEVMSIKSNGKGRGITQQSNLLVGDYSFFRNYQRNYLGRVNLKTNQVEYLQLPVQVIHRDGQSDQLLWDAEGAIEPWGKKRKGPLKLNYWAFVHNDMKNSRGFEVMGDERSRGNGWGHVATQIPTAIGEYLYIPIMNGTVYVLKWNAEKWDENALVAINDLGPPGQAWNRASLSFSGGKIYAHTIKELICIK